MGLCLWSLETDDAAASVFSGRQRAAGPISRLRRAAWGAIFGIPSGRLRRDARPVFGRLGTEAPCKMAAPHCAPPRHRLPPVTGKLRVPALASHSLHRITAGASRLRAAGPVSGGLGDGPVSSISMPIHQNHHPNSLYPYSTPSFTWHRTQPRLVLA